LVSLGRTGQRLAEALGIKLEDLEHGSPAKWCIVCQGWVPEDMWEDHKEPHKPCS